MTAVAIVAVKHLLVADAKHQHVVSNTHLATAAVILVDITAAVADC